MSGSSSLGGSNSNAKGASVAFGVLPYQYVGLKRTEGNTTTETPTSSLTILPRVLEFSGSFGAWNARPEFSMDTNIPSSLTLTYSLNSNLEVGGYLSFARVTTKNGKTEGVASDFEVGPSAYYTMEAAGMPLELDASLALISRLTEATNEGTTTKTRDKSGYAFSANAEVSRELSSGLEGFAKVGLGYSTETDKSNKNNETTESGLSFNIVPAGLRFKF
jgi:opacity protein-like surface antigen